MCRKIKVVSAENKLSLKKKRNKALKKFKIFYDEPKRQ